MSLEFIDKENPTIEEVKEWFVGVKEKYEEMENKEKELSQKVTSLQEHNQKLFLKLTGEKKQDEEEKIEDEEVPFCLDKETYDLFTEKEKKAFLEIIEEE